MAGERIVYRFGRSAFRDFETGNTKEWLLSNGIGGYANSTVHGNSSRIFSAYLIASLHPPVDRVLVLAKTQEELIFAASEEGRERLFSMGNVPPEASTEGVSVVRRDLATQQYPGYAREGYRFQTDFSFDFWPEYGYFADGVSVRKRIALAYGKNEVAIHYELVNHGSQKAVFSVTPLFDFRPFGAVSEKKELDFQVECRDGELLLTPKAAKEYRIRFAASEGEFYDRAKRPTSMATPNYVVEENQLYCVDAGNGFTGVDNHFTPYELHVALKPGERKELGLLCTVFAAAAEAKEPCAAKETDGGKDPENSAVLSRVQQIFDAARARGEELLRQADVKDALAGRLVLSADHFLVQRESTGLKTVLAGYPWFADWGRDTMIAFTGLTLATGRFAEAREVLLSFAKYVSKGMLPNVFPNQAGEEPMYNTIDASLWYFYAVYKYLQYTTGLPCYQEAWKGRDADCGVHKIRMDGADEETKTISKEEAATQGIRTARKEEEPKEALSEEEIFIRDAIYPALCEIFESYRDGKARYGIHMDTDGLIMGGGGLDQLTWMDVRVGDIVVTPRHGKAVEINALWYNAICCMKLFGERFRAAGGTEKPLEEETSGGKALEAETPDGKTLEGKTSDGKLMDGKILDGKTLDRKTSEGKFSEEELTELAGRVRRSFREKFWDGERGYLSDTVDEDGKKDTTLRPNQIFAVSLPFTMLDEEQERSIVRIVYEKLYTPYGLRSLAQGEQGYRGEYTGRLIKRDLAYHMGTSWGYLSGSFFDAWAKTMGREAHNRVLLREMMERFADHMADGCLGGIAEIFDGDFACDSRGCYTQAWSVAEVLRAWREVGGYPEL